MLPLQRLYKHGLPLAVVWGKELKLAASGGPMKVIVAAVAFLLLIPLAHAGVSSVVIAVGNVSEVPAVNMQVPADFVAVPISIQNNSDDPVQRANELDKTLHAFAEKIRQNPEMEIKFGEVSLSSRKNYSSKLSAVQATAASLPLNSMCSAALSRAQLFSRSQKRFTWQPEA